MREIKLFPDNLGVSIKYTAWWQRLLLFFRPAKISYDDGYYVVSKELFGKIHIIDSGYCLPEGFNALTREVKK